MVLKVHLIILLIISLSTLTYAQNVGINTTNPTYKLDIRGTNDVIDGGDMQISTPSMTNFLRFFGGRTQDANPFIAFNESDTFHLVTTLPDFSTYNRKFTLYPNGKLGLGTDRPQSELDIRTFAIDDGAELHLSNSDASYFLRLFSGKPSNPKPSIFWNSESSLDFARFDGNSNYEPFLNLDGKTIQVLNNDGSVFLGENTGKLDSSYRNTAIGSFSMTYNVTGSNNTALGYQAGSSSGPGISYSNNVLIGYQSGYNINQSNRLFIENSSSTSPLIYGEFDTDLIRINGRQEITGNLNLNQGITSGVALRINGEEALWSNGNYFSYGFGTDHNYFAKPMRIGPVEGSTTPFADLHIVDNAGISNLSIESHNHDAVLQLTGNTNNPSIGWTIRRRNSDSNLEWKHNNINKMKLTTFGRLGIGVPTPLKTLEVAGDSRIFTSINSVSGSDLFISTIENTSNNNSFRNNGLDIIAGHSTFNPGVNSNYVSFDLPNGTNIGAIAQLDQNSLVYYQTSDRRRKKDIHPTKTGINTLMAIRVRDYQWIDGVNTKSPITGFIAQELSDIYPSAVKKGGTDIKSNPWQVAPTQLIPLMVKSTQDQQLAIENLQKENQELNLRIERLEKILEMQE